MQNSNIDLKVMGVKGGSPSFNENKGQVTVFIDSHPQFICVDAFEGSGNSYKRMNETKITIQDKYGRVWQGSFAELSAQLFEPIN